LAGTISDSLSRPILIGEREVVVSVSIGVAYGAAHYESAEQIIRDADTAMHRARAQGLGRQMVFDATMHEKALDQLTMEQELRKALEREELVLHYQPIVRLEDGLPAGVEALLRWQHPDRGMVSPLNFIPLAEETGLILPIGDWVLEAALRQLVETGRRYPAMGQSFMSVNLSVKQLGDTRIVERIARIIGEAGARPENVKLEVTESMVMANPKEAGRVLEELKRLGVRLAMDDFGIGYSSLSNLSQFPFDMIKIDRSFVRPLSDPGCRERDIVGAIIAMADSLSLTVVAEGIETREQWEFLARRGCKFGQGYHFAKPLDAVSLDQYISLSIDHMPVADVERFRRAFEEA
jgi:EAL domain-containing protein (putative c-di-GMP-specific phosphodiesterase class I)